MTLNARISTLANALVQPTVVVPVTFDDGVGFVDESVPGTIGEHALPRSLTTEWCAQRGLKSEAGSVTVLRSVSGTSVGLVSLGANDEALDSYRLAGAGALRCANDAPVAFLLPTRDLQRAREVAQALVEGALLSTYRYKSGPSDFTFDVVPLGDPLPTVAMHDAVSAGVARGAVVGDAVNWAKRLIDAPPSSMPPRELAREVAERLGGDSFVSVDVWSEPKIREERLGGLLGVGEGSAQPTRLVYAIYDPKPGASLPHVALVGKGVTFDSGGLSLKPPASQENMKTDMTGAAVVIAVMSMASRLQLALRVTAIAPMTENLPSDKALKPGDVLTIRNGKTIEVLNTDAEGRLILADGLSLAVEAKPDAIVDVATLTGAQRVALGDEIGAFFATTDELAERLAAASAMSGEVLWRMPLHAGYESHVESDVADMKNTGKTGSAGMISAALILQRFTDGIPWAHLDIAGPARSDSTHGYTAKGATAFSARTLLTFLEECAREAEAF